jgi:hypothetical protein
VSEQRLVLAVVVWTRKPDGSDEEQFHYVVRAERRPSSRPETRPRHGGHPW